MEIEKGKIANALTSVAINHVVATTDDLYDEEINLYQNDINKLFIGDVDDLKKQISASTDSILESISANSLTITQRLALLATQSSVDNIATQVGAIATEINSSSHGLAAIKTAIDNIEKTEGIDQQSIIDLFETNE